MPESYGYSEQWADLLRRLVKAELARRAVSYDELSEKLAAIGVEKSASNLSTSINSGAFGAQLLLQILTVIGSRQLDLALIREELGLGQ